MNQLAFDQQIETFLSVCRTCSLATVDEHARPHAANVQYASDSSLRLVWVSKPQAAHSEHLRDRPATAVTIYAHQDSPDRIHGLQLRGRSEAVPQSEQADALSLYQQKYPFTLDPPYCDAIAGQQLYRFTPRWLRWIDNRQSFGFKIEKDLPG